MYRPDHDAIQEVAASLRQSLSQSVEYLVPWFYSSMPDYYYASTTREERAEHLNAILFNRVLDEEQTATLTGKDGNRITFIASARRRHILTSLCRALGPRDISIAEITTSTDRRILLATYHYDAPAGTALADPALKTRLPDILREGGKGLTPAALKAFLARACGTYLARSTDERVCRHFSLVSRLEDPAKSHATLVDFDNTAYAESTRIMIALHTRQGARTLLRIGQVLEGRGVQVLRGYLDLFTAAADRPVCIASLYVVDGKGKQIDLSGTLRQELERSLRALVWAPQNELDALLEDGAFQLDETGLLGAMGEFSHQMLSKRNRYAYSLDNCLAAVIKQPKAARAIVECFRAHFDPGQPAPKRKRNPSGSGSGSGSAAAAARERAVAALDDVTDSLEWDILNQMIAFTDHVLKTNAFVPDKAALAFRMHPASLDPQHYPEAPFGYFFFCARRCKGFHVRFRDMARGGVRVVLPRTQEHHALESARLFDEAFGLATAQQLKNKDIPEGGSKAVILVECGADRDEAVKACVDAFLDVILAKDDGTPALPAVLDRYGREEVIYLGPDENITPALIEWIAMRARVRGYRYASAFISSKPGAGINHKEFGVTSEGVIVYLERVLATLGIDPAHESFTIKMTGGPDGDVAGNALRILTERYGKNACVVAISDGSGCAYDPAGLDQTELMRLFRAAAPIAGFAKNRLGRDKRAFILDAQGKNGRIRDDLHNVVPADVFIPAGGRPNTMNDGNWRRFLAEDGLPSARAIVEGANIFLTAEARHRLEGAGVLIIKDSSANKCGVICSSYEVLANLIMNEEEFLAIKKEFVHDVIDILRDRARCEADLLLSTWVASGKTRSLIDLSMEVSKEINLVTDRVMELLARGGADPMSVPVFRKLILDYLPPVVRERHTARVGKRVPRAHLMALLAARIASKIVYQEGLGWMNETMLARLPEFVTAYLEQEQVALDCIAAVRASKLPRRGEILAVLEAAARRTLVRNKTGLG